MYISWQHHTTILNDRVFNDEPLSDADEALLDRIERDYLAAKSGAEREDFDYWGQ
jgi:hypothetical protein